MNIVTLTGRMARPATVRFNGDKPRTNFTTPETAETADETTAA